MLLQGVQEVVDVAVASARRHPSVGVKTGVTDEPLPGLKAVVLEGEALVFVKEEVRLRLGLETMKTGNARSIPPDELARKIFAMNFQG